MKSQKAFFLSSFIIASTISAGSNVYAAIITSGCANTNVSCTLSELENGAFFAVNSVVFENFQLQNGPGQSVTVTPKKIDSGGLWVGFALNFDPTLSVAEKGRTVSFDITYDVLSNSQSSIGLAYSDLNMGQMHGAGDSINALLTQSTGVFNNQVHCDGVGSCEGSNAASNPFGFPYPYGEASFSAVTQLTVGEGLSLIIQNDTGGDNPYAEINGFQNLYRVIPEPETLALFMLGLIPLIMSSRVQKSLSRIGPKDD